MNAIIKHSVHLWAGITPQSAEMILRIATALLIVCAAALVLAHAEIYSTETMRAAAAAAFSGPDCSEDVC